MERRLLRTGWRWMIGGITKVANQCSTWLQKLQGQSSRRWLQATQTSALRSHYCRPCRCGAYILESRLRLSRATSARSCVWTNETLNVLDDRLRVAGVSEAGIGEWSDVIESSTDITVFCGDSTDMTTFRNRHDTCVFPTDTPQHSV